MVLSYYLLKYPYKLLWLYNNSFFKKPSSVFYCSDLLDIIIFNQVQKHLKQIPVIAKNGKVAKILKSNLIDSEIYPSYPKAVIMCRHACHKFPEKKILKFGFRHGAYHFKKFSNPQNYNAFTNFFVTSPYEVELAKEIGIHTCISIGYPKLDPAFDGTYDNDFLYSIKQSLNLNNDLPILIFTATWDKSGMSAIDQWIYNLSLLTKNYNVLVTVHPWTSKKYIEILENSPLIHYIKSADIVPYLMISDCIIGDTSSIIAEACALDKSIITFVVPNAKRSLKEIEELINNISWKVSNFQDLIHLLPYAIHNANEKSIQRKNANQIMFHALDGKAGLRAANIITSFLPELKRD